MGVSLSTYIMLKRVMRGRGKRKEKEKEKGTGKGTGKGTEMETEMETEMGKGKAVTRSSVFRLTSFRLRRRATVWNRSG